MNRLFACIALAAFVAHDAQAQSRRPLQTGWRIQSSATAGRDGATISTSRYRPRGWHAATVPSTVVGTLVDDKVYPDPFYAMNLRALPGMTYKIGGNFVHTAMDSTSPFRIPWWYRTSFTATKPRSGHVLLQFDGINYRANIWLNGHRIADSTQIAGTYRRYELDVTDVLATRGANVLAVEIFAPTPPDLQTTWVDWNPSPPDKDMGLWQPVWLATTGDVVVRYPQVVSHVDTATLRGADLTIGADVKNLSSTAVTGVVTAHVAGVTVQRPVTVGAHDSAYVEFTRDSFPQLHLADARLWWPAELGTPALYTLDVAFESNGKTSDKQQTRSGSVKSPRSSRRRGDGCSASMESGSSSVAAGGHRICSFALSPGGRTRSFATPSTCTSTRFAWRATTRTTTSSSARTVSVSW
jgi:Beta-galactosidase/beta-glucuronidase